MSEDEPDYFCTSCDWYGDYDEVFVCGHCYNEICPKCGEIVIDKETHDNNERLNAYEED